MTGKTNYENFNAAPASIKNQLPGYSYDAAGNLLSDGLGHGFTYDAENRIIAAGGFTYVYDGDGKRVKKCSATPCSSGTLYWTGIGSDTLFESDLSGNSTAGYTYFEGRRIARVDYPANVIHYYFSDHLGSASVITDTVGTMPPQKESDYYPYGGEIAISGSDPNRYKFTGKERDAESNLDNFGARYYGSSLGRFMQTDPKQFTLKTRANPQKWNKYAYVLNNPLALFDPDGREEVTVILRDFIRDQSVTVAGRTFAGDNRSFSGDANASFRTAIAVRVETDPNIRANPLIGVTKSFGETKQLDSNGNVSNRATQTQGIADPKVTRDANGNVVIGLSENAKNPLTPPALTPGIRADLTVNVNQSASSVSVTGEVSTFPAFELNVDRAGSGDTTNIPLSDPGLGASGLNLFSQKDVFVFQPLPPEPPENQGQK